MALRVRRELEIIWGLIAAQVERWERLQSESSQIMNAIITHSTPIALLASSGSDSTKFSQVLGVLGDFADVSSQLVRANIISLERLLSSIYTAL